MSRIAVAILLTCLPLAASAGEPALPNVLVILADDLGFSDLGSYGGEIDTPNLDRLAAGGLRFTQGYNTARCWPTRAALLTGYYPQAIGRDALPGGEGGARGARPGWAKLLPARLAAAGYRSYHSGKWHIDGDPREEGFARSLDVLGVGQSNFFDPAGVTVEGRPLSADTADFYATTAIGDHAVDCLAEHARDHAGKPFFHYVAFTAPHFPLQAPPEVIAKYRQRYLAGWEAVRAARAERLASLGIVGSPLSAVERNLGPPYAFPQALEILGPGEVNRPHPWDDLTPEQREFQATKMAIHAAMVDVMDREVGRILAQLEAMNAFENTLVVFLSDNGASAEIMVRGEGHNPEAPPGSRQSYLCLGPGWSSCANTPFRRHKTWVHEGGIATPWIVHWPAGIAAAGELRRQPVHAIDLVPTVLELARVPAEEAQSAPPLHGRSFAKALADAAVPPVHESLWWCHEGHRAVRTGDWKLVAAKGEPWELYDLANDRCETNDLAATEPDRVAALEKEWNRIAEECRCLAPAPAARAKPSRREAAPAKAAGAARPPNVVIVFADDLGYGDLGCYGGTAAATPAIDSLARDGIRFTDFHVAQAVCSASRAALLTGCYPNRIGISGALGPSARHGLADEETTLAELLRARGYRTAAVGKWHLGHHAPFLPTRHGFDEYFGLPYSNDMWPRHPEAKAGTFPPLPLFDGEAIVDADVSPEDQATLTARYAARAVDFIERAGGAADDRPFFLYLAHSMPHVPLFPGEAFRGKSPGGLYGDVLAEIDASVAAVLAALDRTGHADDTLVIFTSDNGPWLSYGDHAGSAGPLREGKGTSFEGGVRVPCVARLPGVAPAGAVCDAPAMTIDLVPTIAALTGEPLPSDRAGQLTVGGRRIDGRDIGELLRGRPADPAAEPVYGFWYADNQLQAVREGDWKLLLPHTSRSMAGQSPGKGGVPGKYRPLPVGRELYDLSTDPGESRDVAANHPDIVARLEAHAERARADLGDSLTKRKGAGVRPAGSLSAAAAPEPRPAVPPTPADVPDGEQPKQVPDVGKAPEGRRPNILLIVADDQSPFDLRAYAPGSQLETPVLDSLAARGCVLDAAYHMGSFSGAVCTPSRHMLMTGRSVWHLPIGPGGGKQGQPGSGFKRRCPADIEDHVLAAVFNAAGYDTMRTCKEGNSYEGANRRFTVRHDATKREGTIEGGSAWHAERVLDFLAAREAAGDTDPFLVFYGFSHPHDTRDGTPELLAKYGATNHADASCPPPRHEGQPPLPAAWLPAHPFDDTHMEVRDEVAVSGVWRRRDEATIRNELGREFACSENIDVQIGRVLDKLRALGELDDTWIVYTADHGIAIGRHGLQGKQNLYEHTWRVPLIVAGPGVKAGSRAPGNVYLADILATLCDIAGIEPPATNEGTSFLPVLTGEVPAIRDAVYGVYSGGAKPGIRSVRQGDWKLVKYESPAGGLVTQLFDLRENPEEFLQEHHDPAVMAVSHASPAPHQKNLADDPAHTEKRREMEALLLAEMQRHDDPYRFSDQPAMETAR